MFFIAIFILHICVSVGECMEVRGQLVGVCCLPPPSGRSNTGGQARLAASEDILLPRETLSLLAIQQEVVGCGEAGMWECGDAGMLAPH